MSDPVTHRCELCGREFIWANPNNPRDPFGRYVVIDGKRELVECGGRIVLIEPLSEPTGDIPYIRRFPPTNTAAPTSASLEAEPK